MADWTQADWANKTLVYLTVAPAGVTPPADDTNTATEVSQSVYEQMRKLGLAPFAVSAVPEWAQQPLKKILAYELAPEFGISGQRLAELQNGAAKGVKELRQQCAGYRHPIPAKARFY